MQSIPLAVLKLNNLSDVIEIILKLHAIHTACGIETCQEKLVTFWFWNCMQSIPLAVFFYFPLLFFKRRIFLWHNEAITKTFCWEG